MTYESNAERVQVAADERRHPALQKLGRAFIALARDQLQATSTALTSDNSSPEQTDATPPGTEPTGALS